MLNESELKDLASKIVARFRGKYPFGVTGSDARQDAYLHLLEQEPKWDASCGILRDPWLVTKVWGILKDKYGKAWKQAYSQPQYPANEPGSGDEDTRIDLQDAIARLPEKQRDAMTLHLQGYKQVEIAKLLGGVNPSYVSQLLSAARKGLKTLLGEAYT